MLQEAELQNVPLQKDLATDSLTSELFSHVFLSLTPGFQV